MDSGRNSVVWVEVTEWIVVTFILVVYLQDRGSDQTRLNNLETLIL